MSFAITASFVSTVATVGGIYMNYQAGNDAQEASMQNAVANAKEAQARKEAAEFNAAVLEQNAKFVEEGKAVTRENYGLARRRLAETKKAVVGEVRASAAASGIDAGWGSAQDIQDDSERGYQIDRNVLIKSERNEIREADIEKYNLLTEAALARKQGQYYESAGAASIRAGVSSSRAARTAQVGTLLSGIGQVASSWRPSGSSRQTTRSQNHATTNFSTQPGGGANH